MNSIGNRKRAPAAPKRVGNTKYTNIIILPQLIFLFIILIPNNNHITALINTHIILLSHIRSDA